MALWVSADDSAPEPIVKLRQRDIATLARLKTATVQKALRGLELAGAIEKMRKNPRGPVQGYRLIRHRHGAKSPPSPGEEGGTAAPTPRAGAKPGVTTVGQDQFAGLNGAARTKSPTRAPGRQPTKQHEEVTARKKGCAKTAKTRRGPPLAAPISTEVTVLTADEAAKLLGIHRLTLYEQAREGRIPCRRAGRRFIFVKERLVAWLLGLDEPPNGA